MNTGALLLAAGFSRRFGGIKLNACLPGDKSPGNNTVFTQSLRRLMVVTNNIVVITRQDLLDSGLLDPLTDAERSAFHIELCPEASLGLGHTLASGISRMEGTDACLVCLSDMPMVRSDTLERIFSSLDSQHIIVPTHNGARGNPVGFGRTFYSLLAQRNGDTGARDIIQQHADRVKEVPVNDTGIFHDIDTPDDLGSF